MPSINRGLRTQVRKLRPDLLPDTLAAARDDRTLVVDWVNRGPVRENWGDAIAPEIARRLSGRPVVNRRDVLNLRRRTVHTTIGSMIATIDTDGFEIWGSVLIDGGFALKARPGRVHAVRGPHTYMRLRDLGVDCRERFGDPALLFPRLYRRDVDKVHDLGIVPHFKEFSLPAVTTLAEQGVHVIDIRGGTTQVVDEINRCRRVASSSLHGLVAADAYGVPAIWIRFSDLPAGDGFKFRDYLSSTESRPEDSLLVGDGTPLTQIEAGFASGPPDPLLLGDLANDLLDACPFLVRDRVLDDGSIL